MSQRFASNSIFVLFILLFQLTSCSEGTPTENAEEKITIDYRAELWRCHEALDEAIIEDFFSPPVASRVYVYPFLALYEGQNGGPNIIENDFGTEITKDPSNSIFAFYLVAQELVYTTESLTQGIAAFEKTLEEAGRSKEEIEEAKKRGETIAEIILERATNDGYTASRSMRSYEPENSIGKWKPTPPDYTDALEPHWPKIQPIHLDSARQFLCPAPPTFDLNESSPFYAELREVLDTVAMIQKNKDDRFESAKFWDCNPFVPVHQGHVTFAEKKLTPGGHWLRIAKGAMETKALSFEECVKIYAILSSGIFDGFISCWDAKYHYNYIRPITVAQEQFDETWETLLYTPNFPEYPSGHSVISGASSTILTELIGSDYAFTDSSELRFGMPPRNFGSFYEARDEAAISRLYGGIHFRSAIEQGVNQGNAIGNYVLSRFKE